MNEQTKIKIEQKSALSMTDAKYYRTTRNVIEVICMRKKIIKCSTLHELSLKRLKKIIIIIKDNNYNIYLALAYTFWCVFNAVVIVCESALVLTG